MLASMSDALLTDLVAEFADLAGRYIDRALTPTEAVASLDGVRSRVLELPHREVTEVSAVSIDGTELSDDALAALVVDRSRGSVTRDTWWIGCTIDVEYTHGYTTTPPGLVRACREYVRAKALEASGNQPRNTISFTDSSGFSYRESTPDWDNGRPTGLLVVDQVLNSFRTRAMVL